MYRIGVDVGGTFTDAVAVDAKNLRLIGIVKIPTTHHHPNGVAEGIRIALKDLMERCRIEAKDVVFIAHGTTQATNALLEGDVSAVGVVSYGTGFTSRKVKKETHFEQLDLSAGKKIPVSSYFIKDLSEQTLADTFEEIKTKRIMSVVASSAYSVDDPDPENLIAGSAALRGLNCTATHEMSSLYGLRTRTKTAVINASILPKMMETAHFLSDSVLSLGIEKPLMIMRSDGGVMSASEVTKRPIQTILSGPAGSVAGALLSENIFQGIFLEVGGTSTDISVIKNGKVMIKWAQIGSHKTYVNSLDIHTAAVAGGSMLRQENGRIVCGPRSAHIAGLEYCCFAPRFDECMLQAEEYRLPQDKAEYLVLKDKITQKKYAVTATCLANYSGHITRDSFSAGNVENVRIALKLLKEYTKKNVNNIVSEAQEDFSKRLSHIIEDLSDTYKLARDEIVLVGAGGGCDALVPIVAEYMKLPFSRCRNAEAIAPIGVAMAMVRETCERTISAPSQTDLQNLREKAIECAVKSGANRNLIEVFIETDPAKNIVRAVATGITDGTLAVKSLPKKNREKILDIIVGREKAAKNPPCAETYNEHYFVFLFDSESRGLKKYFFRKKTMALYVAENTGVIKLKKTNGTFKTAEIRNFVSVLNSLMEEYSEYGDAGERIPEVFAIIRDRIIDYSMIKTRQQVLDLALFEAKQYDGEETVIIALGL